jgi:hypothetical protein
MVTRNHGPIGRKVQIGQVAAVSLVAVIRNVVLGRVPADLDDDGRRLLEQAPASPRWTCRAWWR